MQKIVGYIALVLLITSCFKEEAYDGEVIFRPSQQLYDGADFTPFSGAIAYSYAAEEDGAVDDIEITSYEDALNGVVRVVKSGEVLKPIATSSPYTKAQPTDEYAISIPVKRQFVYFVVVDTENKDYAYGFYEMGVNIKTVYISLTFRSWYADIVTTRNWIYVVPVANTDEGYVGKIPTI